MNRPDRSAFRPGRPPHVLYTVIKSGSLVPVSVVDAPGRRHTECTEMAGAVLAGLALSETLFHLRDPLARTNVLHVKLRV